jgi:hypothetical protein
MKKRGASKILEIILIILMIFAMIILLYNLFRFHIKDQGEVSEAKMQLMTEETDIDKVEGNLTYATNISITITKGPGRVIIRNVTILNHTVNADVFSVADLSGTMMASCKFPPCWTNQSICENRCGGTWALSSPFCTAYCYDNKTTCESGCNGVWNSTWNYCDDYNTQDECYFNQTNCENRCGGSWIRPYTCTNPHDSCALAKGENCTNFCGVWEDKIGQTKIANKAFVENVLNISGNRVGLVGYATIANESDYSPLSNDTASPKIYN